MQNMNENEMLKCDFCIESFFDEETLATHVLSFHKSIIVGKRKCDLVIKKEVQIVNHVEKHFVQKVPLDFISKQLISIKNSNVTNARKHFHTKVI